MKRVLVSIVCLFSSVAGAATLECGIGPFRGFKATLTPMSAEFFHVSNGSAQVGYASAQRMACTGHSLEDVHCVGFWFGLSDRVAQVRVRKTDEGFVAFFNNHDETVMNGAFKPCVVK